MLFRHQVSLVCERRVRPRQAAKKQSGPGLRRETRRSRRKTAEGSCRRNSKSLIESLLHGPASLHCCYHILGTPEPNCTLSWRDAKLSLREKSSNASWRWRSCSMAKRLDSVGKTKERPLALSLRSQDHFALSSTIDRYYQKLKCATHAYGSCRLLALHVILRPSTLQQQFQWRQTSVTCPLKYGSS